jgi:hypothetical protein
VLTVKLPENPKIRMLNSIPDPIADYVVTPFGHPLISLSARRVIDGWFWWNTLLCAFALVFTCKVHAHDTATIPKGSVDKPQPSHCLPDGSGYLRARLKGAIEAELDWGNDDTDCTGAVRPTDGGIRMRFTGEIGNAKTGTRQRLVLVFGIAKLREGVAAKALPVNVTVIREGTAEFFGTRGDDKCTLDQVKQTALVGIPHRSRSYRVEARGFCTEPARAVEGNGAVLISRFDYAGRVDFEMEESDGDGASSSTPNRTQTQQ